MSGPALLLARLALTGSSSVASLLLGGVTAAAAVGGPLVGTWLDRSVRPVRVLSVARGGYAVGLTPVLCGPGRVPLPVPLAVAVGAAVAGPPAQWSLTGALALAAAVDGIAVVVGVVLSRLRRG